MEQKLVCDTVKDLLPLYVDELTSEASNQSIEAHLAECDVCRTALEQMTEHVEVEAAPEVENFKKYLKKSKLSIFYAVMVVLAFIAVAVCLIVNVAVELRLSWSLIVIGSIITAYLPAYTAITAEKHKFIKAAAVLNGCVFGLLLLIQAVAYGIMEIGSVWIWNVGLPIAALWSAVVWIAIICNVCFNWNLLISLAILCFLAVPGNGLTNWITGNYRSMADFANNYISNGLGDMVMGIVFLIIGFVMQTRKKNSEN